MANQLNYEEDINWDEKQDSLSDAIHNIPFEYNLDEVQEILEITIMIVRKTIQRIRETNSSYFS